MDIYRDISEIPKEINSVLTVGTFDGVHIGHQAILNKVIEKSKENKLRSVVVTFDPHPRTVLYQNLKKIGILTSTEKKLELFYEFGIDTVLLINFTKHFSNIEPKVFILDYLVEKIGLKEIVLGYDHRFGNNRDGDNNLIRLYSYLNEFELTVIPPISCDKYIVSSTKIREMIENDQISTANKLLGRSFSFDGLVVEGEKRGSVLGYPTANLRLSEPHLVHPAKGVYAVKLTLPDCAGTSNNNVYAGVLNFGSRPTFTDSEELVAEVHILDFNQSIYGKKIEVHLLDKIRDEQKFLSKEGLIKQIELDIEKTRLIIR